MSYEPLDLLIDRLEEQRMGVIEALGNGAAKDFAEYQKSVGKCQGLLIAQSLIQDLAKNLETSDD